MRLILPKTQSFLILAIGCTLGLLVGTRVSRAAHDNQSSKLEIVRINAAVPTAGDQKYPAEGSSEAQKLHVAVASGQKYDGSFKEATSYLSKDRKYRVGLWESGPGTLTSTGYPADEYCLVVSGELVITNASGRREEFHPGDSFVIPKGWVGTWDMKTRFKKIEVDLEQ